MLLLGKSEATKDEVRILISSEHPGPDDLEASFILDSVYDNQIIPFCHLLEVGRMVVFSGLDCPLDCVIEISISLFLCVPQRALSIISSSIRNSALNHTRLYHQDSLFLGFHSTVSPQVSVVLCPH